MESARIRFTRKHPMTTSDITREDALQFLQECSWDDITYLEDLANCYRAIEGKEPPDPDDDADFLASWYMRERP